MKFLTKEKLKHYLLAAGAVTLDVVLVMALLALAFGLDLKTLTLA